MLIWKKFLDFPLFQPSVVLCTDKFALKRCPISFIMQTKFLTDAQGNQLSFLFTGRLDNGDSSFTCPKKNCTCPICCFRNTADVVLFLALSLLSLNTRH